MEYLPRSLPALVIWFINYAAKNVVHGPNLGALPAEVTQQTNDSLTLQQAVNGQEVRQTDAQEWTAYRDLVIYGPINTPMPPVPTAGAVGGLPIGAAAAIVPRLRAIVERYKNHPNMTPAIAEDLGIASTPGGPGPTQPAITGAAETDYIVRLGFAMHGHDMIEIQCERGNETAFTTIGFDTATPFLDSRAPLIAGSPETRRYRARFVDNGFPVGDWSDIITVTARA